MPLQSPGHTGDPKHRFSFSEGYHCTYETTSYSHTQLSSQKNAQTSTEGKGREIQRKIQSSVPLSVWTTKSSDFVLSFETKKKNLVFLLLTFLLHYLTKSFERLRHVALTVAFRTFLNVNCSTKAVFVGWFVCFPNNNIALKTLNCRW